jgi:thiol peroxidase
MAEITLRGNPLHTVGDLPAVGTAAPPFTLTGKDLGDVTVGDFAGKAVILNIFPSLDTGVCAASVRAFNERAAGQERFAVLNVSADLPFAQGRFCTAEGIENVTSASTFRSDFGETYGVKIADGPMAGLMSRAVVVVDADGNVAYTEQVPEIAQEPNYDAALSAVS